MGAKQILLLLLLFAAPSCSARCYDERELEVVANRKLRTIHQPPEPDVSRVGERCPLDLYKRLASVSLEDRSLSPWRYESSVTEDNVFPSTFVQARCLCRGCIQIPDRRTAEVVETHDYNSVPIEQTKMFLRRELCTDEQAATKRYRLTPVYRKVVVGCTCARVHVSS